MKATVLFACLLGALTSELRAETSFLLNDPKESGLESAPIDVSGAMQGAAAVWSIASTLVPVIAAMEISQSSDDGHNTSLINWLTIGGLLAGPSAGQFYARAPGQAVLGMGIRGAGALLFLSGAAQAIGSVSCGMSFGGDGGSQDKCDDHDGGGLMLLGFATYLGGTVYSLVDGGFAVTRYLNRQSESQFGWSPVVSPGKGGSSRTGVAAWMRF
jgi:hypothetical protein